MNQRSIARLSLLVAAFVFLGLSQSRAALAPLTFQPNPADLGDLDHHLVYSWRIDNINLSNVSITSASITFKNISNWDSNPNMLFCWLMDTATHSGVATIQDVDASQAPVTDISDAFLSANSLVLSSTAKIKLFQQSFTTTGQDFTYNLNAQQLAALSSYIANGHDIAFGFDPDCHFFNDGITFTLNVAPIPEAASLIPVACLVAASTIFEARRRRRLAAAALQD
jgi:hypothetical protein